MLRPLVRMLVAALALSTVVGPAHAQWNAEPFAGGVPLGNSRVAPAIASDGAAGAFVARAGAGVSVQHLSATGAPLWGANGVGVSSLTAAGVRIVAAPGGGAVVVWRETNGALNEVLRAQRVDGNGAPLWTAGGVLLSGTSLPKQHLSVIADGTGGAIVAWSQDRLLHGIETPFVGLAARVDGTGALAWGPVSLSTATGEQFEPVVVSDGSGGAIVTWSDSRNTALQLYSQRYDASGVAQWAANGVAGTFAFGESSPVAVSDGAGGVIHAWVDTRSGAHIYADRLNGAGVEQWSVIGMGVCVAPAGAQAEPAIASDGAGGALVAYDDTRNGANDIYVQRVNASGVPQWTADGVALVTAANAQQTPGLVPDGAGGAIVTWSDQRSGLNTDLYAQRITSAGSPLWAANGIAVSEAFAVTTGPAIAVADTGCALVAWTDQRAGSGRAFAQRLDHLGYLGDPAPRILAVRDVPQDQGGKLKLSWAASDLDSDARRLIDHYDVERWSGAAWVLQSTDAFFPYGGTLAAYSLVVGSLADSTSPASPFSVYRVKAVATAAAANAVWISRPDSARSIDDLAPAPVPLAGTYAAGATHLAWPAGADGDLAGYRLYRAGRLDATPATATRVAELSGTTYDDDPGGPAAYLLTVVDVHGNESAATRWAPPGVELPTATTPAALALAPPGPNPARGPVTLEFALPRDGAAELAIRDVAGRRVRSLAAGPSVAGAHRVTWDLRDDGGRPVPPGEYFARLRAGQETRVRRVSVVR